MVKFLILIVILALLGGGVFFGYKKYSTSQNSNAGLNGKLANISLKEEILLFSSRQFPEIHNAFTDFDKEIRLIKDEIERLDIIEQQYPKQAAIVQSEKQIWNSVMDDSRSVLSTLESEVENIFVTYKVNIEKGENLIKVKKPELIKVSRKALDFSRSHTKRLTQKKK